ncbi:transcription factor HHO2-like [Nicotiana tomentosiformis]|uniref:transcription factor HHO2-like n=1 Tax=Nicotiana tomentosiformis TaxID=4098 RepID=UPI00051C9B6D|nr:transcription factor HHO2-like [Nicotiana tomentosiformis]
MMINNHENNYTEKMQRCQQYIDALEEERNKIQVFSRELPLCLELVTQAIDTYKQQLSGTTTEYNLNAQSDVECSEEHTSSDVPILEEFIPLKRTFSHENEEEDEDERESHKSKTYNISDTSCSKDNKNSDKSCKKSDWLRSVQLWNNNPTPDPTPKEELKPKKVAVVEVKKNGSGGAFHPFKKEKSAPAAIEPPTSAVVSAAAASSTAETGSGSKKEEKDEKRKQRRCWSPELHRRFLQALQQLGGSHVATPKQIRELMKVDGLTNDEVKSHLQKYRLHTRRPSPSSIHNNNQQPPQFVVVGGIWVPPPEYAAMAAAAPSASGEASGVANSNGIYAPIATLPKGPIHDVSGGTLKQRQHNNKPSRSSEHGSGSHSDGGGVHSNSPTTSSSTHTTTASPAY